ncbi:MAG: L-dopachrome tautomerase-related protein [Bacteroidota bacterium]
MKSSISLIGLLLLLFGATSTAQDYEVYATFDGVRPANPAVAKDGSIFVTMHPMDGADVSLMKVDAKGNHQIFPSKEWASNPVKGIGIANAIGIQATEDNKLYVLDWGNAEHSAKVIVWDLAKGGLDRLYYIPQSIRQKNDFLQDFALDQQRKMLYIADMGRADLLGEQEPAIIALNLNTGQCKRLLTKHPSFLAGEEAALIEGQPLTVSTPEGKKPVNLGLNPIAIDPNNEWVYYGTVNAGNIYRIKSEMLADFSKTDAQLAEGIETYGPKPASDGISVDGEGNVYITSISESGIGVTTKGNYRLLFSHKELSWPDGMSYGSDGYFYVVINQLHKAAALNGGKELASKPYKLIRFKSLGKNKIGR